MKYTNIKIDKLIPYVNNARKHSETQVAQIAASIKKFGFINPIIIDKNYNLIAGHGRLLAAQKLELKEVPCISVEHLSELEKKAYILADNRLSELSEWDNDLLKIELQELKIDDFDLNLIGFDNFNFDEFSPNLSDDDETDEEDKQHKLIVIFDDQDKMQMLFDELNSKGYKVKAG